MGAEVSTPDEEQINAAQLAIAEYESLGSEHQMQSTERIMKALDAGEITAKPYNDFILINIALQDLFEHLGPAGVYHVLNKLVKHVKDNYADPTTRPPLSSNDN